MAGLADVMADAVAALPPSSVTILSGAGASVEGPASLPTGWELTQRVFDAYFAPGTLAAVLEHHAAVGWWSPDPCGPKKPRPEPRPPRLETVLGVVAAAHGQDAVGAALADIRAARPNRLHRFFAGHLAEGGRHITANFDGCVEAAADADYPGWRARGRLLHFHGSFMADPSGGSLGATLARVQGGFTDPVAAQFRDFFPADGVLLVVGYSGSDFFDVDTAIRAMAPGSLAGLRVIWIAHGAAPWHQLDLTEKAVVPPGTSSSPEVPPLIRHLQQAGAGVEMVCGPTGDLLRAIAERWKLPDPGAPGPRVPWAATLSADPDRRLVATFRLYRELGLHDEVAHMLDVGPPPGIDRQAAWLARSEVLWEQGRWGTLRRMWLNGKVPTEFSAAERAERVGACLWVQGRLVPAYLWLTWHRRHCPDAEGRLTLAETEGRVIEHMARVPELHLLGRLLAPGLIRSLGDTGQNAGVHLYRRRNDLVSSLLSVGGQSRSKEEAQTSSQWFTEAGNLTAALNYRHRQYRDTYDPKVDDAALASGYRELQRQFNSVGAPADGWAAHRLPGAHRVFSTAEVIRGLRAVQYGWWHRFRLLSRHLVRRTQYRTKGGAG